MAKRVNADYTILVGNLDMSADVSTIDWPITMDAVEVTNYASGLDREYLAGLRKPMLTVQGFHNVPQPDTLLGSYPSGFPVSVSLVRPVAEGSIVYAFKAMSSAYQQTFPVGAAAGFSASFECGSGDQRVTRGVHLVSRAAAKTATGASTGGNYGAVTATQKAYAYLFVPTVSGTSPTLDVIIQSDDNSGFTTPVTRMTFTQETGVTAGYQALSVAGAITDTYWRASWTISGTGPSFDFAVAFAIL